MKSYKDPRDQSDRCREAANRIAALVRPINARNSRARTFISWQRCCVNGQPRYCDRLLALPRYPGLRAHMHILTKRVWKPSRASYDQIEVVALLAKPKEKPKETPKIPCVLYRIAE